MSPKAFLAAGLVFPVSLNEITFSGASFLAGLIQGHELAARPVTLGPGRRAAHPGLGLRPLLHRAFARVVADRFVGSHRVILLCWCGDCWNDGNLPAGLVLNGDAARVVHAGGRSNLAGGGPGFGQGIFIVTAVQSRWILQCRPVRPPTQHASA